MRALLDSDALETSPTCVPSDQRRVDCAPSHGRRQSTWCRRTGISKP